MKHLPVHLREEAISDLQEIAGYIVKMGGSRRVAFGFIQRIKGRCLSIGDAPNGAVLREDLGKVIRLATFERSGVIAYRVLPDKVEVVNVFYGGREYSAIMRDNH